MMPFHPCRILSRLRSESGSINATAAFAGVGLTAIVSGAAVASAGGMIPVAHDSAAQQNASQLGTAQGLALMMDGKYTDTPGLESGSYLPAYRATTGPRRFATEAGSNGTCFVVVSRSATGKHYFATDRIPGPEELLPGTDTGCLPAAQVGRMAASLDTAAS